ncbi:MAG: peptide deformylase [Polyangiaceae bacterium]|nr:peptide deformylase [Polyangiaceae bacterium]
MAILEILEYPDPRLREVAKPVGEITDEIRTLVDSMAETMYDAPGVGLAATQVGVNLRIFIIDIAGEDEPSDLKVFINPELFDADGVQVYKEGCLSFPGATEDIKRAETIKVRARDISGKAFELEAEGLMAVALQHENDHLNGVLMIDKLNAFQRRKMGQKLARARSEEATSNQ